MEKLNPTEWDDVPTNPVRPAPDNWLDLTLVVDETDLVRNASNRKAILNFFNNDTYRHY